MKSGPYNDDDCADQRFLAHEPGRSEENDDGDGDGCNREGKFGSAASDDYHELDGESEKEEKIEFQEGDVNLVLKVATLHSQVGRDALVDGPGKFVVKFPGACGKEDRADRENAGNSDQEWLGVGPYVLADIIVLGQAQNGVSDLVHLNGAVDEQANIVHNQSDNLDGVFHA